MYLALDTKEIHRNTVIVNSVKPALNITEFTSGIFICTSLLGSPWENSVLTMNVLSYFPRKWICLCYGLIPLLHSCYRSIRCFIFYHKIDPDQVTQK